MKKCDQNENMLSLALLYLGIPRDEVESYEIYDDLDVIVKTKDGRKYLFDSSVQRIMFLGHEGEKLDERRWKREFGRRVERKMWRKGFDQKSLAAAIGVSQSMISRIICGKSMPNIYILYRISEVLGCRMDDLTKEY